MRKNQNKNRICGGKRHVSVFLQITAVYLIISFCQIMLEGQTEKDWSVNTQTDHWGFQFIFSEFNCWSLSYLEVFIVSSRGFSVDQGNRYDHEVALGTPRALFGPCIEGLHAGDVPHSMWPSGGHYSEGKEGNKKENLHV